LYREPSRLPFVLNDWTYMRPRTFDLFGPDVYQIASMAKTTDNPRMGRPRGFDTTAALDAAMRVFWKRDTKAGTPQQATEQDIVGLAANWPNVQQALFSIPDWRGRILV
jgi:hypothetical protein